jgi:fatty acid desaturase
MREAAPRWTAVNTEPRPRRRRRYAPLVIAVAMAAMIWGVIALSGMALSAWLA